MRQRLLAILAGALALGFLACASRPIEMPPLTSEATGAVHPGKFVWLDLVTDDVDDAVEFYGALFGWRFEPTEDELYTEIFHEDRPMGGIVGVELDELEEFDSAWIASLSVADVDSAVEVVRSRGGEVHREPRELGKRGRFALVSDPQGAMLALLRAKLGDPSDRRARPGDWLWLELWTLDSGAAASFYKALAPYELDTVDFRGQSYYMLVTEGVPRGGVVQLPEDDMQPNWLPYVLVTDPDAVVEKALALDAELIVRDEDAAILLDPTGAALGIQRWDKNDDTAGLR